MPHRFPIPIPPGWIVMFVFPIIMLLSVLFSGYDHTPTHALPPPGSAHNGEFGRFLLSALLYMAGNVIQFAKFDRSESALLANGDVDRLDVSSFCNYAARA